MRTLQHDTAAVTTVCAAQIEGMDHISSTLAAAAGFSRWEDAAAYAQQCGIAVTPGEEALQRLQRIAASERKNPHMIHPSVPPQLRSSYYQLLFKWAPLIAVSLSDLRTPATVPPMQIRTFGQPVAKPAMRYSPAHR